MSIMDRGSDPPSLSWCGCQVLLNQGLKLLDLHFTPNWLHFDFVSKRS